MRIITMSDRAPVEIDEKEWPIIGQGENNREDLTMDPRNMAVQRDDDRAVYLRQLTHIAKASAGSRLFGPTVVRFSFDGTVAIMGRQDGGWARGSYGADTLEDIARHWKVAFLDYGRDEHSAFVRVKPLEN
jgi:hypothetical protein